MVVPCNHTLLYTKVMENIVGIDMHEKCTHTTVVTNENHHHHDEGSNHHHACTPFCACGISHFILNIPSFQAIDASNLPFNGNTQNLEPTEWAMPTDNYKQLLSKDIWHPPQVV